MSCVLVASLSTSDSMASTAQHSRAGPSKKYLSVGVIGRTGRVRLNASPQRRLQAGVGEVAAGNAGHGSREGEALWIALSRKCLQHGAAGIQAQQPRHLVECFACRIARTCLRCLLSHT